MGALLTAGCAAGPTSAQQALEAQTVEEICALVPGLARGYRDAMAALGAYELGDSGSGGITDELVANARAEGQWAEARSEAGLLWPWGTAPEEYGDPELASIAGDAEFLVHASLDDPELAATLDQVSASCADLA